MTIKQAPDPNSPIANLQKAAKRADAEADRDDVLLSAKAQIVSSDATLRAGRASIDSTKETLAESRKRIKADIARYEALAREHGADLSEEGFNEALRKVGKQGR